MRRFEGPREWGRGSQWFVEQSQSVCGGVVFLLESGRGRFDGKPGRECC